MNTYNNRALSRGLHVIDTLLAAPRSMLLTEIAETTGLDRATTYRLLRVLLMHGYVHRDERSKRYSIKFKLNPLRKRELPGVIAKLVRPALKKLYDETDAAISVASLLGTEVCYYQEYLGRDQIAERATLYRGKRLPSHATACGKALLARVAPAEFDRIYEYIPLHAYTSNTLLTINDLRGSLRKGLERGYAVSQGEFQRNRLCIATPIDTPAGMSPLAVSATVPLSQTNIQTVDGLIEKVRSTAKSAANIIASYGSSL